MVKSRKQRSFIAKYTKKSISKRLKTMIWNYRIGLCIGSVLCPSCGDQEITQSDFDCGHIIAESNRGSLNVNNLMPICRQCNLSMSSMDMNIFMIRQFNRNLSTIIKQQKSNKKHISNIINTLRSKEILKKKIKEINKIILSNEIFSM